MSIGNRPTSFARIVGLACAAALLLSASSAPAKEIKLARHPDYHDGKVVFSYLGDLWTVSEDGSNPQRLTVHTARDVYPRFSPDGKWIAFSSSRQGNYDVYVIPARGGDARQLTFHSANDTVVGWSRDSKKIVFSSPRGNPFPGIPNLYEVPVAGGLEQQMATDWGYWGSYSPDGKRFAFNRHPMVWSRKHYRGSYAADLWVTDLEAKNYRRIVDDNLPDEQRPNNFWPMYANGFIYFVSDRDVMAKAGSSEAMRSTNNIWKVSDVGGEPPIQVTKHKSGSLFYPSLSSDGRVIVYEEDFGLWKLDLSTGQSKEIKIDIVSEDKENAVETIAVNGEADSYDLSPSGKRAVIATNGELFTIATDKGDVQRLTQSSNVREGQPQWSPDGKRIAFVSDRSGREEIWTCDEFGQQLVKITNHNCDKGTPVWSPDSKSLLFSGSDKALYKHDFDSRQTTVVARGEVISFGGMAIGSPQWSPDGKWISFTREGDNLLPHVYVVSAQQGGDGQRVTDRDVYSDSRALWTPDGKRIVYLAGADIGNIGQAGRSTAQIYMVSLTPETKDATDKSIDSEAEAAASREENRGIGRPRGDDAEGADAPPVRPAARAGAQAKVDVKIDFNRIGRRARQLTRSGDQIGAMAISPDSKTLYFVTTGTEGGRPVQSIWSLQLDGERQTRIGQGTRSSDDDAPPGPGGMFGGITALQVSKDGRTLYYRQGGGIYAQSLGGAGLGGATASAAEAGSATPAPGGRGGQAATATGASPGSAARKLSFTAKIEVDHRQVRKQVFEESWRVMKNRFYDVEMHGVDWARMKSTYAPLLDYVADQEELHNVISQMIGELNASHTGVSPGGRGGRRGAPTATGAQTRHPGFELAADKGYYKVSHIYKHGPADKDWVKLEVGQYVLAIDGQDIKEGDNYWKHYTLAPSSRLELTVNSKPSKEGAWRTKVAPASTTAVSDWQYDKWVADRKAMVEKLSSGQFGYLHIRQMNETSLRQFERDLADQHNKKALVIDQRFNPGGSIDQELLQILQQKQYQYTRGRDSVQVTRPLRGFFGPMVVMENERSTSDAEVFPDGFRTLKLGKVVGVTTYGAVIGTGSYTLMDGSALRTPGSGLWNVNGTNLENYGVPPDVYVDNRPEATLKGRDAQLEKAVEVLREELKKKARKD